MYTTDFLCIGRTATLTPLTGMLAMDAMMLRTISSITIPDHVYLRRREWTNLTKPGSFWWWMGALPKFTLITASLSVITPMTEAAKTNTAFRLGWASKHAQLPARGVLSRRLFRVRAQFESSFFELGSTGARKFSRDILRKRESQLGMLYWEVSGPTWCNLGAAVGRWWVSLVFASLSVTQFSFAPGATTWEDNWRRPGRRKRCCY